MKYCFILIIVVGFTHCLFSQVKNVETDNGHNIFYYPSGQISSEGKMVNGRPDGLWKSYHVNGNLKAIGIRKYALLDSVWCFYNNDGKIAEKINYIDGKKNGYYYTFKYFKNKNDSLVGYLASRELYLNNRKHGVSEYFYKNGNIYQSVSYLEGKKNGLTRQYNPYGLLVLIIDYREGREVDRNIINQYRDSLKHGVWQEFYPNGKLKKEENYTNGSLNGLVKLYDLKGELLNAYRYEEGILKDTAVNIENEIDIVEEFYDIKDEQGNLIKRKSGGFKEGIPVGVHRTYDSLGRVNSSRMYDSNGNLIAEGIVNEEGDKLGDWEYYYETGDIKSRGKYRSNRRIGPWKYYFENGSIEQEGIFKKGVPDGLWRWYFDTGEIKREEYYRLGMEEGESIEYDIEGNIIAQGNYIEGMKEGKWRYNFYFHTEEGNYINDYKDGEWLYFYSNGVKYFEGKFTQGNENGKHIYYYKNGKLKEVQYYIFGRKTKNWEYYDYYGSLLKILTFEDNKLIKIDGISVETE